MGHREDESPSRLALLVDRVAEAFGGDYLTPPVDPAQVSFWFRAFEAQHDEHDVASIPAEWIVGAIPPALRGTFYRCGPGKYEVHGEAEHHLFDGDGMIAAWRFDDAGVSFRNRFVRTAAFDAEQASGEFETLGFGRALPGGLVNNLGRPIKNAANTNVTLHDGRLYALYEGGQPYEIDPLTLETRGQRDLDGLLGRDGFFSAHPKRDRGGLWNFGMDFQPIPTLHFFHLPDRGAPRRIASKRMLEPINPHDCAVTERWLLVPASPFKLQLERLPLVFAGHLTMAQVLEWKPEDGTEIHLVRKDGVGGVRSVRYDQAELIMHVVNAYDDGDDIVLDYLSYEDADVMGVLASILHNRPREIDDTTLRRLRIHADDRVTTEDLVRLDGEFPRIDDRFVGRRHRWCWGLDLTDDTLFGRRLFQLDLDTREVTWLDLGDRIAGEPVFVPRAPGAPEGDGWVLSTVYSEPDHRTTLLIIPTGDAFAQGPVAEIRLPFHLPVPFHCAFFGV